MAETAERLSSPRRRLPDGAFEPVDWDTAIREVAARIAAVRDAHGGDAILHYAGERHLGSAYARATLAALGSTQATSAPARQTAGERRADAQLFGSPRCHPAGDFDHAEVAVFVDPARTRIADFSIQPRADALCLCAILSVLVQEDLVDHAFLERRTHGLVELSEVLAAVPIAACSEKAGVAEALVREAARRMAGGGRGGGVAVQVGPALQTSMLASYLAKLLYLLTGSFARRGGMNIPSRMGGLAEGEGLQASPVEGRFRAMIVEAADPAGEGAEMRRALTALDTLVVIDTSMTETAGLAHYVLPIPSPDETWEANLVTQGFPENVIHLRAPVLDPLPGTLTQPEIHRRLVRALGALRDEDLAELRASTRFMRLEGRGDFADAFFQALAARPHLVPLAPVVLYETLGRSLPDRAAPAAVLWSLAHRCASAYPDSVRRAGFTGESRELGEQLFDAILMSRSGVVFTADDYAETWQRLETPDKRIRLAVPELLAELRAATASVP